MFVKLPSFPRKRKRMNSSGPKGREKDSTRPFAELIPGCVAGVAGRPGIRLIRKGTAVRGGKVGGEGPQTLQRESEVRKGENGGGKKKKSEGGKKRGGNA